MIRPLALSTWLLIAVPAPGGAEAPPTTIEALSEVPIERDGCLDHAVKELGMSAKRVEGQRVWNIGPQFLHSAVAKGGTLAVHFERAEQVTRVRVNVTFPGPLKAEAEQAEIESRLTSMAHKMTQICGVTKPMVRCEVSPSGGAKVPCRHGP